MYIELAPLENHTWETVTAVTRRDGSSCMLCEKVYGTLCVEFVLPNIDNIVDRCVLTCVPCYAKLKRGDMMTVPPRLCYFLSKKGPVEGMYSYPVYGDLILQGLDI